MENKRTTPDEAAVPARRGRPRLVSLRAAGTALLVMILCLVSIVSFGEVSRRIRFWWVGSVKVDGLTFYLHPEDTYLTQYLLDHGCYEPAETRLFRSKVRPGDTVVDVGANIGWYTVIASKLVGDRGRVIAFEPDPTSFEILKRNVEVNRCDNVILEQKALSNEEGTIQLFIAEHHKGLHRIFDWGDGRKSVAVEALPLDDYLENLDGNVSVIKVDTEGAEGVILEGMEKTLARNEDVRLFLEFDPHNLQQAGYDPRQLLDRCQAHGFAFHAVSETGKRVVSVADAEDVFKLQAADASALNLYLERPARESATEKVTR